MDTDVEQPHPAPQTSTPALDMASSLREAALLSRKRRRVESDTPALPPRFAPESTLQLDYDYDVPAALKPSPLSHPTATEPTGPTEDIEDGQIREEGEISDTETSPPRQSPTPPPRLRPRPFNPKPQESARAEIPLPPSAIEASAASPLELPDAQAWHPTSLEPLVLETSTYRLDTNHVRPGLSSSSSVLQLSPSLLIFCSDSRSIQHRQRHRP